MSAHGKKGGRKGAGHFLSVAATKRGVSGRLSERYWAEQPGSGVEEEGVGAAGPL